MASGLLVIIGIALFWAGFVSSISFMEAWLKFKAKGVTIPIGLSIGKKIFKALNRVEWVLFFLFVAAWIYFKVRMDIRVLEPLLILLILLVQTFYLLPKLNTRADLIMEGKTLGRSYVHLYYVAIEFLKIGILLLTGIFI